MPRRLVTDDQLARVQGMKAVVQRLGIVLGAPLAGWLVAGYGLAAAFGVNAVLFSLSVAALAATRLRPAGRAASDPCPEAADRRTGLLADVVTGLRFVRASRHLQVMLVVVAVVEVGFSGPFNVGLPLLALDRGWGASGVGLVLGGFGAGAALTSLGIAVGGHVPRAGAVAGAAALLLGGMVAAIGLSPTLPWAVAASTVLGTASGICGTLLNSLVLHAAGPEQAGRVMALVSVAAMGSIPLGYAATGSLVGVAGPVLPFVLGGGATALAGVAALGLTSIRTAVLPRA
jgi:predicted MFS family arabinose efflux permease